MLLQLSWRYESKMMWSVFLKEGQSKPGKLFKRIILIVCAVKWNQKVFVFTVKYCRRIYSENSYENFYVLGAKIYMVLWPGQAGDKGHAFMGWGKYCIKSIAKTLAEASERQAINLLPVCPSSFPLFLRTLYISFC